MCNSRSYFCTDRIGEVNGSGFVSKVVHRLPFRHSRQAGALSPSEAVDLELRLMGFHLKPSLGCLRYDQFPVMLKDNLRRIARFQRHACGVMKDRQPV